MNIRWLFCPWKFAFIAPLIAAGLATILTPMIGILAFAPIGIFLLPLIAILFGVMPAFLTGIIFTILVLIFDAILKIKQINTIMGFSLGAFSSIAPVLLFNNIVLTEPSPFTATSLMFNLIGILSGGLTGARCAYVEQQNKLLTDAPQ